MIDQRWHELIERIQLQSLPIDVLGPALAIRHEPTLNLISGIYHELHQQPATIILPFPPEMSTQGLVQYISNANPDTLIVDLHRDLAPLDPPQCLSQFI